MSKVIASPRFFFSFFASAGGRKEMTGGYKDEKEHGVPVVPVDVTTETAMLESVVSESSRAEAFTSSFKVTAIFRQTAPLKCSAKGNLRTRHC